MYILEHFLCTVGQRSKGDPYNNNEQVSKGVSKVRYIRSDHKSVASTVTSAVGMSDNAAPDR